MLQSFQTYQCSSFDPIHNKKRTYIHAKEVQFKIRNKIRWLRIVTDFLYTWQFVRLWWVSFINDLRSDFAWKHIFPFIWCFTNIMTWHNLLSWTISVFQVTPLRIKFSSTPYKHTLCQDSEFNIWSKCVDCLARTFS